MDKLDKLAKDPQYKNIKFASINCDSETGARNIIEEFDTPRWLNVDHYHMDVEHKELAKEQLGFKTVPFLVVLDENGQIVQKGSPKQVNLESIVNPRVERNKENIPPKKIQPQPVQRIFEMDEDF